MDNGRLGLKRIKGWIHSQIGRVLKSVWLGRLVGKAFGNSIPFRGLRIVTPEGDHLTKANLFFRMYESAECRFLGRLPGAIPAVDLGAGIGVTAALLAQRAPRVICVEANYDLVPLIRENVKRNAPSAQLSIFERGIAYGPTTFIWSDHLTGGHLGQDGTQIATSSLEAILEEVGL